MPYEKFFYPFLKELREKISEFIAKESPVWV